MTHARRRFMLLTLFAFLLNALVPFFAVYGAPSKDVSSIFGDTILLCTADGFKLVSRADLDRQDHQPDPHYQCALCYVAAHGTLTQPKEAGPAYLPPVTGIAYSLAAPAPAARHLSLAFGSRAPPHAFIG